MPLSSPYPSLWAWVLWSPCCWWVVGVIIVVVMGMGIVVTMLMVVVMGVGGGGGGVVAVVAIVGHMIWPITNLGILFVGHITLNVK